MVDCSEHDLKRKISFSSSTEVSPSTTQLNKRQALNMSSVNSSSGVNVESLDPPPTNNPGVQPSGVPPGTPAPYTYQFMPGTGPMYMPGYYPPQMSSTPGPRPPGVRAMGPMLPPPSDIPGVSELSDATINKIAIAVRASVMQELSGYIEDRIEERVQPLCMAYDKLCEQNRELIQRIDDLEMYSRKSCVRIFGVSEEKVNTDQVVKDICKDLKVEIKDTDLAVSHRVGPKSVDKPRPIIARINNYSVRHELLQTSKKEKLHKMKDWENVWVNQELTKARGKVAAEVRKLCKNDIAKATFIWDGKIFVIDHSDHKHKLFSMDDLFRVMPQIQEAKVAKDLRDAQQQKSE